MITQNVRLGLNSSNETIAPGTQLATFNARSTGNEILALWFKIDIFKNESYVYWAVLSCGAVYNAVHGELLVYF